MKKISYLLFLILFLSSCEQTTITHGNSESNQSLDSETVLLGSWRGALLSPGGELPFGIEITKSNDKYQAKIINGEEKVDTSSVVFENKQVTINFEWYDARINARLTEDGTMMSGEWSKTAPNKISSLPFHAVKDYKYRFTPQESNDKPPKVAGHWEVVFTDEDGQSPAVAEFQQNKDTVTGTFLTPTGDYRYLAGDIQGQDLSLSTFDGAHAFLFTARLNNSQLEGHFWSRDTYRATWTAQPSEDTSGVLPNSWEMNKVTTQDQSVAFGFEDLQGKIVQLSDEKFKGKPVVINLFGTWCPNCNDEAPVLAEFYRKYNSQGLEIIGLAFEFTEEPERDKRQIKAFKERHNIDYTILLAGGNDKANATKTLGFLDKVIAYPTSIFLDKNHKVVNIHTGFSGPGTGDHYTKLVEELEQQITELLN